MVIYTIYEIPGIKVGCTVDLNARRQWRNDDRYDGEIVVIETIERERDDEESWQLAGDTERAWQLLKGYPPDVLSYGESRKRMIEASRKGQTLGAARAAEVMTVEQKSARGRKGGLQSSKSRTKEEKSVHGRMGGQRIAELGIGPSIRRGTCPYCGVVATLLNLGRWHGKNCKKAPRV